MRRRHELCTSCLRPPRFAGARNAIGVRDGAIPPDRNVVRLCRSLRSESGCDLSSSDGFHCARRCSQRGADIGFARLCQRAAARIDRARGRANKSAILESAGAYSAISGRKGRGQASRVRTPARRNLSIPFLKPGGAPKGRARSFARMRPRASHLARQPSYNP